MIYNEDVLLNEDGSTGSVMQITIENQNDLDIINYCTGKFLFSIRDYKIGDCFTTVLTNEAANSIKNVDIYTANGTVKPTQEVIESNLDYLNLPNNGE